MPCQCASSRALGISSLRHCTSKGCLPSRTSWAGAWGLGFRDLGFRVHGLDVSGIGLSLGIWHVAGRKFIRLKIENVLLWALSSM